MRFGQLWPALRGFVWICDFSLPDNLLPTGIVDSVTNVVPQMFLDTATTKQPLGV